MADTVEYFSSTLPQKLNNDNDLASMGAVFQFEIDGAGTWHVENASVTQGTHDAPDCVITSDKDTSSSSSSQSRHSSFRKKDKMNQEMQSSHQARVIDEEQKSPAVGNR